MVSSPYDSVIPHTVAPHEDTGVNNVQLGMWLFLASEVMLFGGFFAAYILLRTGDPSWQGGRDFQLGLPLAVVNTLVLITSSLTMARACTACRRGDFRAFRRFQLATVLGGLAFLVVKSVGYAAKVEHGLLPSTHNFLALYFTLTGLHALHVLGGVLVNAYHWGPGARMWHADPQRFTNRVEVSGLYWHFVDLVWLAMFPLLYLL